LPTGLEISVPTQADRSCTSMTRTADEWTELP